MSVLLDEAGAALLDEAGVALLDEAGTIPVDAQATMAYRGNTSVTASATIELEAGPPNAEVATLASDSWISMYPG